MMRGIPQLVLAAGIALTAVFFCGCSDPMTSNTARTAVEQFLLTDCIEQATDQMRFSVYRGKKAFMDYTYLAPQVDKAVVQGMVERRLAECNVVVTADKKAADIVIQVVCPVLATDQTKFLIGTPSLPIPVPDTSVQIVIPEIPFFLKLTRKGYGRFSLNILKAADMTPLETQKGINTRAEFVNWALLLFPWTSHNMEMRETVPNDDTQYQMVWD